MKTNEKRRGDVRWVDDKLQQLIDVGVGTLCSEVWVIVPDLTEEQVLKALSHERVLQTASDVGASVGQPDNLSQATHVILDEFSGDEPCLAEGVNDIEPNDKLPKPLAPVCVQIHRTADVSSTISALDRADEALSKAMTGLDELKDMVSLKHPPSTEEQAIAKITLGVIHNTVLAERARCVAILQERVAQWDKDIAEFRAQRTGSRGELEYISGLNTKKDIWQNAIKAIQDEGET